jgi:hypothetical protein
MDAQVLGPIEGSQSGPAAFVSGAMQSLPEQSMLIQRRRSAAADFMWHERVSPSRSCDATKQTLRGSLLGVDFI